MYTVRLHLADKDYLGTERSIKLAQHTAAKLALNDFRNLTNNYNPDISQLNGKQLCYFSFLGQKINISFYE